MLLEELLDIAKRQKLLKLIDVLDDIGINAHIQHPDNHLSYYAVEFNLIKSPLLDKCFDKMGRDHYELAPAWSNTVARVFFDNSKIMAYIYDKITNMYLRIELCLSLDKQLIEDALIDVIFYTCMRTIK